MALLCLRRLIITAITLTSLIFTQSHGQAARPNGLNENQFAPVEPGDPEFRERARDICPTSIRTLDGSCTNYENKLWASAGTPHYSYIHQSSSRIPTGQDLPSARLISNVICTQTSDVFNRRGLSEFLVYFAQFLDHTIVATATNSSESMPIPIPTYDSIFANFTGGTLPFQRSVRGVVMHEGDAERPINSLSSACDLASVYSSDDVRIRSLREFRNGLMKTSTNGMLPLNRDGLVNAPTKEATYFLAGDHRANEHPVLTALHTLFVREHNRLCTELLVAFPLWTDEELFQMARKINIFQFQKIVYEEFLPQMIGRKLSPYSGYNKHVNPTLSTVFTTAAYRIGHTMIANVITRKGPGMSPLPSLDVSDMFFRTTGVMEGGMEPFIRGAIYSPAQEVDVLVSSSIRNHLFHNIPEEKGFDLISLNLQRGRDHAIPPYNTIRRMFGRPHAVYFRDITSNLALQAKLATLYGTADRVEAWIGLMAEDHMPGASMGPTLYRVWRSEFRRMRDGDRFFYQRSKILPDEVWHKVPRAREIMFERDTMKQIILRNSEVTEEEMRGSIWRSLKQ